MVEVQQTSIKLPKDLLIAIKARAIEKGTSQNNIITEVLRKEFKLSGNKEEKKKTKIINNKLPKLEGKAEDLEDLTGFIESDHETDALELKSMVLTDQTRFKR